MAGTEWCRYRAPMIAVQPADPSVGEQLRRWRTGRRLSQLDLATRAEVSTRHLSFVENGRSRPSRELVLHLAEHLDVPLRERNRLLVAAGYAPVYGEAGFDAPELDAVRATVAELLGAHDPYPAVVVDGHWDAVAFNDAALVLVDGVAPHLLEPTMNVVRVSLHPDGLAPRIHNLEAFAAHVVGRLRRQVEATGDPVLAGLLDEVAGHVGSPARPVRATPDVVLPLVVDTTIGTLRLVSIIATFGAPLDAAVSELAIEAFYPADEETRRALHAARSR